MNKIKHIFTFLILIIISVITIFIISCGKQDTDIYYPDNYGVITGDTAINITFKYYDDAGDIGEDGTIFLSGDMNRWGLTSTPLKKITDKTYTISVSILPDTYFYRYIINHNPTIAQNQWVYSLEDRKFYNGRKIQITESDNGSTIEDDKKRIRYNISLNSELDDTLKGYSSIQAALLYNSIRYYDNGNIFAADENGLVKLVSYLTADTYYNLYVYYKSYENDKGYSMVKMDSIYIHHNTDTYIGSFELERLSTPRQVTITHIPENNNITSVLFLSSFNNYGNYDLTNTSSNVKMTKVQDGDTYSITISIYPGLYHYYFAEIDENNFKYYWGIEDKTKPKLFDWKNSEYGRYLIVE